MAAKIRLFSIAAIELRLLKSDPPQLGVVVHGYAVSTGWTDAELVPLERKLSADGILDLDFVATPPADISLPALTPQTAELIWTADVNRLVGVRVVSRTGDVVQLLVQQPEPAEGRTTQIAGESQHPHFAAGRSGATTDAVGEEGPDPAMAAPTTLALGEEGGFTTTMLGEGGGGYPPTTLMLGEEGGGLPPTTQMLGEGGGGLPPTTQMVGEGGGGYPPTTLMLGEEGGGLPPTTQMLGEEGGGLPPTTQMLGEEGGGLPPAGQAESAQRAGPMTTLALGEEERGGGTVFTTLVVGEEGTTAPWFEEMSGPQNPTTQMVGEGWHDPANQNPLGRR
jgi:hypothetical protein